MNKSNNRNYRKERFLKERFQKSANLGKWTFDIYENINNQCLCLGASFNWNFCLSLEIQFGIWTMYIERGK